MDNILTHSNYHQQSWTKDTISSPIVDFRLLGQVDIRRFDGRNFTLNGTQEQITAVQRAQNFINYHCIPICRFDGKNWIPVGGQQVDWFVQRHEWEIK